MRLSEHPDVDNVSLPVPATDESSTEWDGDDMKQAAGLNAGAYHDNGFHGQAYADNAGGRNIRIGVLGSFGGDGGADHPGFDDYQSGPTRAFEYTCIGNPCVAGGSTASAHSIKVAGLAAGSIRQNQISGLTDQEELERTGVVEEADVYLYSIDSGDTNDAKRALELAVEQGIDVFVSSHNFGTTACDGSIGSDLEDTVYEAQLSEMIVVQSAGNDYDNSGNCTLTGLSEAPSVMNVGGLGEFPASFTASSYSTSDIMPGSDRGGMTATVNGVNRTGALSMVGPMAPACPKYYMNTTGGISTSSACGTSYASPQVGGAGAVLKDWFLDQGHTAITIEGRLYAVLLAMTDRADSSSTYRTHGFDPHWGAGRFQLRYFAGTEPGSPWAWETYSAVLTDLQASDHSFSGTGTESNQLNQYKAYAMVFERDRIDIADVDLSVKDQNCGAGSNFLGFDFSYDVKSMVRLGNGAAGEALCNRLFASYIPSGESRRVHVFSYYSGGTSMR